MLGDLLNDCQATLGVENIGVSWIRFNQKILCSKVTLLRKQTP